MSTSLIIPAANEPMLAETIRSARKSAPKIEIIVVDDASTDGCCVDCGADIVLRHDEPIGVANSRLDGAEASSRECYIFADAHHCFEGRVLNEISELALRYNAIAWPRVQGLGKDGQNPKATSCRGSYLSPCMDKGRVGVIGNHWWKTQHRDDICRSYGMFVPYAIPAAVFDRVKWSRLMRGYGGHEAAVAVRAFFTETDIVYHHGMIARHLFRDKSAVNRSNRDWWRNHILTCRICFSQNTWDRYWLPNVFLPQVERRNMTDELNGPEVISEHERFQAIKQRNDAAYWRGLYHESPPNGIE